MSNLKGGGMIKRKDPKDLITILGQSKLLVADVTYRNLVPNDMMLVRVKGTR